MKIYLASRYSRRLELCEHREVLEAQGHTVTSRWLNGKHQINTTDQPIGDHGELLVEAGNDVQAAFFRLKFAQEDLKDVLDAEVVISFTEAPRSDASRGGRHVEFGIALAKTKRLIVVGFRENIFHWLPSVEFFATWKEVVL